MNRIRVLIVDGASQTRRSIQNLLGQDPELEVVGAFGGGQLALAKLNDLIPDVVVLDVAMPYKEGLSTLASLRRTHPALPVIMFSDLTDRGSPTTLDALELGATGYVTKLAVNAGFDRSVQVELAARIKSVSMTAGRTRKVTDEPTPTRNTAPHLNFRDDSAAPHAFPAAFVPETVRSARVVAIATSTGGPAALAELLSSLPPSFSTPIIIVQHMASGFTAGLADSLRRQTGRHVAEVETPQLLGAASVWISAGGRHVVVNRQGVRDYIMPNDDPPEGGCCPSANILFRSVAGVFAAESLAVVLTGMGSDGLDGCRSIRHAGGTILVQDQASSVAWGMPGQVATAGLADLVVSLPDMAREIARCTIHKRG